MYSGTHCDVLHMCVGAYVPMCVRSEARAGGYLVCPTSSLSALRQGVPLNPKLAVLGRLPSQRVLRACMSPASLLLTQALEIQTQVFMLAKQGPLLVEPCPQPYKLVCEKQS